MYKKTQWAIAWPQPLTIVSSKEHKKKNYLVAEGLGLPITWFCLSWISVCVLKCFPCVFGYLLMWRCEGVFPIEIESLGSINLFSGSMQESYLSTCKYLNVCTVSYLNCSITNVNYLKWWSQTHNILLISNLKLPYVGKSEWASNSVEWIKYI